MNISLAAEPVLHIGHTSITNSLLTTWGIVAFFLLLAFVSRKRLNKIPGRFQNLIELVFGGLLSTTEKVIGRKDVARDLFPFIITAFIFIVFSNWFGLFPGVGPVGLNEIHHGEEVLIPFLRAPTTDLNMVIALALTSVAYVQYLAIKYRGFKSYIGTFFNFSSPIYFFVGLIELVSEFTRIISYSFRLFGNIFAGEVLLLVIYYLTTSLLPQIPILPLPFMLMEMFVGVVQAFVFCFLTIVFTAIATADHGEGHAKEHAKPADLEPAAVAVHTP